MGWGWCFFFFFFKQKTAYEIYQCDWSSDVCSSDLALHRLVNGFRWQDVPIFHSVRLYRPDGSNVDACRRQAVEEGLRVLMPGSLGAELLDELKPDPAIRLNPTPLLKGRFQIGRASCRERV